MKVLQLIDSLHAGGAERVAVNFANALVSKIDGSFICVTREEGILKNSIDKEVIYLFLNKKRTIDFGAIKRLNRFIKSNNIDIIHAHSSSFFLASIIKVINNKIKIVWHDHYGNSEYLKYRKSNILKFTSKYFSYVFCVNKNLEAWAKSYLKVSNLSYLPNFAIKSDIKPVTDLFGENGKRIICLANLRPQKDHITLVNAFSEVVENYPDWTLHCVGKDFKDEYSLNLKERIKSLNLSNNVYLYDSKPDVSNILSQCEIGVLSSKSEGLPIALLEYGLSNLAVVATRVGECATVIENDEFGVLINPENVEELKNAIQVLINDTNTRSQLANNFNNKIETQYSYHAIIERVLVVYNSILN